MMKKIGLSILFLLPSLIAFCQDTTYLDEDHNEVKSISNANYFKVTSHDLVDTNRATVKLYYKSGQIKSEEIYSNLKERKLDGTLKTWYATGQLRKDIQYKDGKLNGHLLTFWANGKPKRIDKFEDNKFIDGKCLNSDGTETKHYDYEIMPKFPGGMNEMIRYLATSTKYPEKAKINEIEGRVVVRFLVNKKGEIAKVKIVKSVSKEIDREAIRVVEHMPDWEPGVIDGEAANIYFSLPIMFRLSDGE